MNLTTKNKNNNKAAVYVSKQKAAPDEAAEIIELISKYNLSLSKEDYQALPELLGYIRIEKLEIIYPIYKTTSDAVLNMGIGHFENTHIPSYAIGVHSVLVGHNGIYGQEYFSDIGSLEVGDRVEILIANESLIYTVTGSEIVLPDEAWFVTDEKINLLTLVTCTPYGSNTHRLLVHCESKGGETE